MYCNWLANIYVIIFELLFWEDWITCATVYTGRLKDSLRELFPFIMWVFGIKRRFLSLIVSDFTHQAVLLAPIFLSFQMCISFYFFTQYVEGKRMFSIGKPTAWILLVVFLQLHVNVIQNSSHIVTTEKLVLTGGCLRAFSCLPSIPVSSLNFLLILSVSFLVITSQIS